VRPTTGYKKYTQMGEYFGESCIWMRVDIIRIFILRSLTGVSAAYNAIFGISAPFETLNTGEAHVASDIDNSSLVFVSKHSIPQWFFFSKLDRRYKESEIPKFTKEEMEQQVEKHKDFHLTEKVTLGDMMKTTTSLGYVALEEANHKHWTYGRIVCVGDAIHKMTPNVFPPLIQLLTYR
jgi:FAD dependent monooxygenase